MAELRNKSMHRENGALPGAGPSPEGWYSRPLAGWVALTLAGHTAKEPAWFWPSAVARGAIRSDT
jgi:hypothetical protein